MNEKVEGKKEGRGIQVKEIDFLESLTGPPCTERN